MSLQFAIFASATGPMIADWSSIAVNVEISTNPHGYATLTAFIPLSPVEAFYWLDRPGLPYAEISDGGTVWRGRVEDVTLTSGGIDITALGAWSVFGDVPYTDTPASVGVGVDPEVIVADILAAARVDNPALLNASTALIQSPGVQVHDEDYEDDKMADILTRLASLGDSQTPPRQWEVGVWEGDRLHFRPRGTDARTWYTDVADLDVERSISQVWNSIDVRYSSGASTTGEADDAESIARYGVVRRKVLTSRTTDMGQAERERDAYLFDRATPIPRAGIRVDRILTATGTPAPKYMVRSGDTLVLRNLPPEAGPTIDRIRTFRISETRYRPDGDRLTITPEAPLPTLDVLLARTMEMIP